MPEQATSRGVTANFVLPPTLMDRLRKVANARGTSMGLIVRQALEAELARLEKGEPVIQVRVERLA